MPDQVGHDEGGVGHDDKIGCKMPDQVGHDENRHCRPALPVIAGPDRQSPLRRYGVRPQWDVCFYLC